MNVRVRKRTLDLQSDEQEETGKAEQLVGDV